MNIKAQLKLLIRIFSYADKGLPLYLLGVAGVASQSFLFNLTYAFALGGLTDAAIESNFSLLRDTLFRLGYTLLALSLAMPVFTYLFDSRTRIITGNIRKRLFSRIQSLPIDSFEKNHSADLLSRINVDIQTAENSYGWPFVLFIMSLISGIGSSVVIFAIDYRIAIASILVGIANMFVNGYFAVPIRKLSEAAQERLSEALQRLSDILGGFQTVKIYNLEKKLSEMFNIQSKKIFSLNMKRAKWQASINSMNWLLIMMNFVGMLTFGGFLVVSGRLDFPSLVMTVQMMNGVVWMFSSIGGFYTGVQRALAGSARVFEIIDKPSEEELETVSFKGNLNESVSKDAVIHFEKVSFAYEGEMEVLRNLDLTIREKERVAFVGPSGSGKSTILKLILGFYPLVKGDIIVMGRSVNHSTKTELRNLTSYVPQESYLFEGSIFENIVYGDLNANIEDVENAAKAAFAHDFIIALPQGYDTVTGERGAQLSGGERQRIAIARAFLKNAPILLLDEATSSLDSLSEQKVQNAVEALMKGRTCLVIAHRLSTIQNADRIVFLDEGEIVEEGDHESLIRANGEYKRQYDLST